MNKLVLVLMFAVALSACHTVAGLGQDVAGTGNALSCAANDALDGKICGRPDRVEEDRR